MSKEYYQQGGNAILIPVHLPNFMIPCLTSIDLDCTPATEAGAANGEDAQLSPALTPCATQRYCTSQK
jgi:hypothetical protein